MLHPGGNVGDGSWIEIDFLPVRFGVSLPGEHPDDFLLARMAMRVVRGVGMILGESDPHVIGAVRIRSDENLAPAPPDRTERHLIENKYFLLGHFQAPSIFMLHNRIHGITN